MEELTQWFYEWGYAGIFVSSLLAGSILPFASEAVLAVAVGAGLRVWPCLLIATAGNTAGGMTCYLLGRAGNPDRIRRWLRISPAKIERMQRFVAGRGAVMALFVALPYVGDAIAVALGFIRANPTVTAAAMGAGKFIRYAIVVCAAKGIMSLF